MLDSRFFRHSVLFAVSLLGVQGTIYFLQFMAAAKMGPEAYGSVRIIESFAAIGAQLATFGLPSIALVRVGIALTDQRRRELVSRCLVIVLGLGIVTAIAFLLLLEFGSLREKVGSHTIGVISLAALMAFRLLLTAITQSRQHYLRLAILSAGSCVVSIATYLVFLLSESDRVFGWLFARVVLELLICGGLLISEIGDYGAKPLELKRKSNDSDSNTIQTLVLLAFPIGGSLVARSLLDNGPVLWIASAGASADVIARFGILATMVTVSLVLVGIVQGVAVPKLALGIQSGAYKSGYARLFGALAILASFGFISLVLLSEFLLPWGHLVAREIIVPGVIIVIAKSAASAMGGYLLVRNEGHMILALNCLTLGFGVLAAIMLSFHNSLLTLPVLLLTLAAIETAAAATYGAIVLFTSRTLSRQRDVSRLEE